MRKSAKYTYQKMNQDVAKNKHSETFYWEGKNIRIITNDEFGSVTNQQGNELVFTLPQITSNPTSKDLSTLAFPINNLKIIHTETLSDKIILFTTNENADCIFLVEEINGVFESTLLFIDNLGFTFDSNIESVSINENEESQKIYWIDGINEIRFINIKKDNINLSKDHLSTVPSVNLYDIEIGDTSVGIIPQIFTNGGNHKAGVIYYAYSLYNKYGVETKTSGLSKPVILEGDLDKDVNKSPIINVYNIDQNFEYIKVYSIFYSSLNQIPKISLIYDNLIESDNLKIIDGNDIIREITLDEFNLTGTLNIIPSFLDIKDGHLFFANYKLNKFDFEFDARAFSFYKDGSNLKADIKHNTDKYQDYKIHIGTNPPTGTLDLTTFLNTIEDDHDAINLNTEAVYNKDGVYGGSGKNVSYTLFNSFGNGLRPGEVYRIGLIGYNHKDEESYVKWISDIRIPLGEIMDINFNVQNLPEEVKAYRLVYVERTQKDNNIKLQGTVNPCINQLDVTNYSAWNGTSYKLSKVLPNYLQRHVANITNSAELDTTVNSVPGFTPNVIRHEKYWNPYLINDSNDITSFYGKHLDSNNIEGNRYEGEIADNNETGINKTEHFLSKREFIINSLDIYQDINISTSDKIRIIGYAKLDSVYDQKKFYTGYNKEKSKFVDIKDRIEYINDENNKQFLFQVDDDIDSTNTGGIRITTSKSPSFFLITESTKKYSHLIGPERYKFNMTVDTVSQDVNRWEYKKSHTNLNYGVIIKNTSLNSVANIHKNAFIIKNEASHILLKDVKYMSFSYITEEYKTQNSVLDTNIEIEKYTKTRSATSTSVFIDSEDLHSKIVSNFNSLTTEDEELYIPIVEIYSENTNRYGGNTYIDRQANKYITFSSKYKRNQNLLTQENYRDSYKKQTSLLRIFETSDFSEDLESTFTEILNINLISNIDSDLRTDNLNEEIGDKTLQKSDEFKYNTVFSQKNNLQKFFPKNNNLSEQEDFITDIVATPKKQLGELIDNWSKISINDRVSLDAEFGGITGLTKVKDNLISFQEDAVSFISINPRVVISSQDGIPTQLGTGKLIERYDYITTKSGTKHSKSICTTDNGIFYYDVLNGTINRITNNNEEISLTKGLYNYIKNYTNQNYKNIINSRIVSFYDSKNEEIYFTFKTNNEFTLCYNLLTDGFTSFYDFKPFLYFGINNNTFSSLGDNKLWRHNSGEYNKFYDQYYPSSITIIFNSDPEQSKILDNIYFNNITTLDNNDVHNIAINKIEVNNSYQKTGEVELNNLIKRKFRNYNIIVPRQELSRNRIRDTYAQIKLIFDHPNNNYKFKLYDLEVFYTLN